jgi:multicomponent Na+:H+ antiporter subunit D
MNNWLVLPFLIPLCTAVLQLSLGRNSTGRRLLGVSSLALQVLVALLLARHVFSAGPTALMVGAWKAPLGIALCLDKMGAIFLCLATAGTFFSVCFGFLEKPASQAHPLRGPLIQFLSAGIALAFVTGDLFNLFVAFEVLLISSYALMTLEAENPAVRHAFPYLAINLFGSTLFVSACGLAYALFGSLNFADISLRAAGMAGDPRITALALMLVLVFALKAGIFPLFYWLPDSYPMMPAPLVAIYAGALTKVGVYCLFRLLVTVLPHDQVLLYELLAWLAVPTMVLGVLGALAKDQVRSILSFHIVSQIGYMLLALALFTPAAAAACLLFIIHQIFAKGSLFLIGGAAQDLNGSDRLGRMGNLWKAAPWLGAAFLLQALSLAGLPPFSGFWGKALIVMEALRAGRPWLAGIALGVSLLTLLSMLKIFLAAFWRQDPTVPVNLKHPGWPSMGLVLGAMVALSLGLGLGAEPFIRLTRSAADELFDGLAYRSAVLDLKGLKGEGFAVGPAAALPAEPAPALPAGGQP